MDDWEPQPDGELNTWIARIRSGERGPEIDGIARAILEEYSLRHWNHVPQNSAVVDWLVDALGAIMEGEKPVEELGLTGKARGAPQKDERNIHIACWVKAVEHRGYTRAHAIQLAAAAFCLEESGVRTIVNRRVKDVTKDLETLEVFLQGRKPPLPKPAGEK